jgi:hypothetical protein
VHAHRQSLGRDPGRAALTGAICDRIERIGFSVRPLAIRTARVSQLIANCKQHLVIRSRQRKMCCVILLLRLDFSGAIENINFLQSTAGATAARLLPL